MSKQDELKPRWLGFALRMQGLARSQAGCAIIEVAVVVDAEGNPLVWLEPKMKKIEPLSARDWLISLLTTNGK